MRMNTTHLRISAALITAATFTTAAVWVHVPSPMPVHFGADGSADGFASKAFGLLLTPFVMIAMSTLTAIVTRAAKLDQQNAQAMGRITVAMNAFMLGMHALIIHAALGTAQVLALSGLFILVGGLWIGMGWIMPSLTQNSVAGIRTPWTLASEANWTVTHRFASKSFIASGVICMVASLLLSGTALFVVAFAAMMVGALAPVVASYALHVARS